MDNLALKMASLNFYNPVTDEFYKKVEFNSKLTNPKQNDLDYTQKVYNGVYANILRYHPQKSKLVSAMSSVDRINIFNTDGSTDYTINNDERQMKDVLYDANSNNNKFYNIDLTLTDNYIYALYAGVSKTNYYEANYTTKIKIYDWDYNLKYVIT